MRRNARSKLNLSIETSSEDPSADSSPSTLSSISPPSTPSSPTSTHSRSDDRIYAISSDGHTFHSSSEDVLAIGRVLTPEADPFAKADIALPTQGTPRPPTPPLSRRASSQTSPASGREQVPLWNAVEKGDSPSNRRTRNSLPASPVSAAYTFPSSCSVYKERPSGREGVHEDSPEFTSKRSPPSAWSPFGSPIGSSAHGGVSPSSSPLRAASVASLSPPRWKPKSKPYASPSYSDFPLPPTAIPSPRPPPNRPLPEIPSSPSSGPISPKDVGRAARVHRSLPPSPYSAGSLPSIPSYHSSRSASSHRSRADALSIGVKSCSLKELTVRHDVADAQVQFVPSSLGAPWSGTVTTFDAFARSVTPPAVRERHARKRSTDSTSTVTASPSSSALHDAARGWDGRGSGRVTAGSPQGSPVVEGNSLSIDTGSSDVFCDASSSRRRRLRDDDADLRSATSHSTAFYSAPSSASSGSSVAVGSTEGGYTQSWQGHAYAYVRPRRYPVTKAASAGPCV